MSKIGLRIIGAPLEEEDAVFRKIDLEEYLKSSSKDEQDDVEVQILQNALDFSSVKGARMHGSKNRNCGCRFITKY